jgi:catechol 2,3-dioxygenase-like lactoylglutathione lyase family enzyme
MFGQGKTQPDMKLEVVLLGVSDVDRARAFYEKLGWRLDIDIAPTDDYRAVQMTPHNSGASIIAWTLRPSRNSYARRQSTTVVSRRRTPSINGGTGTRPT